MPSCDCDSQALQDALRHYRHKVERTNNQLAELQQYLKELDQDQETKGLESVKRAGELIELGGQLGSAMKERSIFGGMEVLGKALAMAMQEMIDDLRERQQEENRAERLRILREELRLDLEEEAEAREQARTELDAYWDCTDRLIPKHIRFQLDIQADGGFLGIVAHSELCSIGQGELRPVEPRPNSLQRLARWLADPELPEYFQAKGELSLTVPAYQWTSSRSDVKAADVTHSEDGGPLSFQCRARWLRGKPSQLELLYITPSGAYTQHVRGQIIAFGHGQSFNSDQDLLPSVSLDLQHYMGIQKGALCMSAAADPAVAWHVSDSHAHASGRSLLDITVTR